MHQAVAQTTIFFILASAALATEWRVGHQCPDAIDTIVPGRHFRGDPGRFPTMSSVHAAMSTCPNITSLKLRVTYLGCTESPDRWNFPFNLRGIDNYPTALQNLSLEGYRFDDVRWNEMKPPELKLREPFFDRLLNWMMSGTAREWWQLRRLPEEQLSKSNLELWMDAMSFSSIHTLSLNHPHQQAIPISIIQLLAPKLSSLSSLAIAGHRAADFILGLGENSLTRLDWTGNCNISSLVKVVQHHGATLTDLSWHSYETLQSKRTVLSPEQLRQLGAAAPNLKSLVIDMGRNGTWPWHHLDAIATGLQGLKNLTLYFDLASECRRQRQDPWMMMPDERDDLCRGVQQYAEPRLNATSTQEVIKFLLERKSVGSWDYIILRAGDWSPQWDGPLYSPGWLDHRSASVEYHLRNNVIESTIAWGDAVHGEPDGDYYGEGLQEL